jgi:glycosyltransferase involved in cell wall biosynthesis
MKERRVGILDGMHGATGGAQLVTAYLATAFSRHCRAELIHDGTTGSLKSLRQSFGLPLTDITERLLERLPPFAKPDLRSTCRELIGAASKLSLGYDLFIYSGFGIPPFCRAPHGLVYCHFPFDCKLSEQARKLPGWHKHGTLSRHLRRLAHYGLWQHRFRGYDCVLANSAFTASWIKSRWGVEAEILFPPVITKIPERPKKNLIVSVGKFTGNVRHCKKQFEQVKAFKEMIEFDSGNWTLRMIGFSDAADSEAYINAVRNASRGLPIEIVENAGRAEVLESLAEARVYWHTMGLDGNESTYPERAEHFGIATVEAMRASCVPVVIATGGQREIIEHGKSGYLCFDLSEMVSATRSVIENGDVLVRMGQSARARSFDFSPERFCSKLALITNEFFPAAVNESTQ